MFQTVRQEVIICPACTNSVPVQESSFATFENHLNCSELCNNWITNKTYTKKIIDEIVSKLQNNSLYCDTCSTSFSNVGNFNKHMKEKPICLKNNLYNHVKLLEEQLESEQYDDDDGETSEKFYLDCYLNNPNCFVRTSSAPFKDKNTYYRNWPNSIYDVDLNWAKNIAINYLQGLKTNGKTGTIVFDFDNTLVFGDPEEIVGIREMELGKDKSGSSIFVLPANQSIVDIVKKSKELGFTNVIASMRPGESYNATVRNLEFIGIPLGSYIDKIYMNQNDRGDKAILYQEIEREYKNIVLIIDDLTPIYKNYSFIKLPCSKHRQSIFIKS